MTGEELDREMRTILLAATPENAMTSVAALIRLGFSAISSWDLIARAIDQKGKQSQ